jgi:glycerol 2-dehydrogenase (NADP+)
LPDGNRDIIFDWPLIKTWRQLEGNAVLLLQVFYSSSRFLIDVYKKGKAKAIGVSNFSEVKLQEILPHAEIKPAVDQLELHPYNPQHNLLKYLKSEGIVAEAYSPLGSTNSPLLKDEVVAEIAQKHNANAAQVLIGWGIAKGIVVLPKSVTPERIASNAKYAKLDQEDVEKLDALAANGKQSRLIKPPWSKSS